MLAHEADLVSFLLAMSLLGIHGESNGLMRQAYDQLGVPGVVMLKTSGAIALTMLTAMRPWAFLPAVGSGLVGAVVNVVAVLV